MMEARGIWGSLEDDKKGRVMAKCRFSLKWGFGSSWSGFGILVNEVFVFYYFESLHLGAMIDLSHPTNDTQCLGYVSLYPPPARPSHVASMDELNQSPDPVLIASHGEVLLFWFFLVYKHPHARMSRNARVCVTLESPSPNVGNPCLSCMCTNGTSSILALLPPPHYLCHI